MEGFGGRYFLPENDGGGNFALERNGSGLCKVYDNNGKVCAVIDYKDHNIDGRKSIIVVYKEGGEVILLQALHGNIGNTSKPRYALCTDEESYQLSFMLQEVVPSIIPGYMGKKIVFHEPAINSVFGALLGANTGVLIALEHGYNAFPFVVLFSLLGAFFFKRLDSIGAKLDCVIRNLFNRFKNKKVPTCSFMEGIFLHRFGARLPWYFPFTQPVTYLRLRRMEKELKKVAKITVRQAKKLSNI